jgi:hypothetical protein
MTSTAVILCDNCNYVLIHNYRRARTHLYTISVQQKHKKGLFRDLCNVMYHERLGNVRDHELNKSHFDRHFPLFHQIQFKVALVPSKAYTHLHLIHTCILHCEFTLKLGNILRDSGWVAVVLFLATLSLFGLKHVDGRWMDVSME